MTINEPTLSTVNHITEKRYYFPKNKATHCHYKNFSIEGNAENPVKSEEILNQEINCEESEAVLTCIILEEVIYSKSSG